MKTIGKMKKYLGTVIGALALTGAVLFGGCKTDGQSGQPDESVKTNKSEKTYVVTVGMETSQFAGDCPGAGVDAKRMTELLRTFSDNVVSFSSETAIKADIKKAMEDAVSKSELFIFYYSGHGGSDWFADTGADEEDGKDEFLCFYDTYMRDNEVWDIISKAKGRVFLMIDACHSRTMWRQPKPFSLQGFIPLAATYNEQGSLAMQCWSGCPDNTYSYGNSAGGKFTNTLLKYFSPYETYDSLWGKIESDKSLRQYEEVQRTKMGADYGSVRMFE